MSLSIFYIVHNSITRSDRRRRTAFPLSSSPVPLPMCSITDVEVEVVEILRHLPNLIRRFKSNRRIRCCRLVWTVKKRRSSITPTVRTKIDQFRSSYYSCCAAASPMETDAEPGVVHKSKAVALSPASPLCFDLSGGEEGVTDTRVKSVPSSPCSRRYKNGKVQDKEVTDEDDSSSLYFPFPLPFKWIEEKKGTIYALLEENKNLHMVNRKWITENDLKVEIKFVIFFVKQEAVDNRNRYKSLVAENSRLKEIKPKWKTSTDQKGN